MSFLYTNNATSTLAAGITAVELSITLQSGEGALFPNPSGGDTFQATLVDAANNIEIVQCTARAGDVLTVLRGQEGTVANAYLSGDSIGLRLTALGITNFAQVIDAVMRALPAVKSAGDLTFSDNVQINIGDSPDGELYSTGTVINFDLNGGVQLIMRDGDSGNANRFVFDIDTGTLTLDGYLAANGGSPAGGSILSWNSTNSRHEPAGFAGLIGAFASLTVPTGWLTCDGASVLVATYPDLHAVIGYDYGGSGLNFNVPDLRGEFIRGWDNTAGNDPDAAGRTDRGDGTTGDNVGTKQDDEYESHRHSDIGQALGDADGSPGGQGFNGSHNTGFAGGNETRPRNVYMHYCIKT